MKFHIWLYHDQGTHKTFAIGYRDKDDPHLKTWAFLSESRLKQQFGKLVLEMAQDSSRERSVEVWVNEPFINLKYDETTR